MMLHQSAAYDNYSCSLCFHCKLVDGFEISQNIQHQAWFSNGVKEHHISQGSIGEGRTEDGNGILPCPIVNRILVLNFLAKFCYYLGRSPNLEPKEA